MTRLLPLIITFLAAPALADPSVTVAFSPGDAEQAVVETIRRAEHSIRLAAYTFTSREVTGALLAAHVHGVEVAAVLDESNAHGRSEAAALIAAGIPVRFDARYAILHDKFLVVDGRAVEKGSFNYTRAAASGRNAENVVVLRDVPGVAAAYEAEWRRLWAESGSR